jgi:hypothetical protein
MSGTFTITFLKFFQWFKIRNNREFYPGFERAAFAAERKPWPARLLRIHSNPSIAREGEVRA